MINFVRVLGRGARLDPPFPPPLGHLVHGPPVLGRGAR